MTWGGSGPFLFDGASIELGFLPIEGAAAPPGGFVIAWALGANSIAGYNMKKNVASQTIGSQMVSATDGSAFTGSVSVTITGNGGTQGGGGACTHEGNGYHSYTPSQAETNYDHIAFTFTGTGAVPATIQVYTTFPQTGDSFGLIGTAGAGLTALGDTRLANLDATVSSRLASASYTAPDNASISAILTDTGTTIPAQISALNDLSSTDVANAVWNAATGDYTTPDTLGGEINDIELQIIEIKAKTDNLTFTVAGQVDANIQYVNDVQVSGTGAGGDEWGPV